MADGYTTTAQSQSVALDAAGALHDVMIVTFQTPDGTQASVRVPLSDYSGASVAAAIEARLPAINEVANL